MAAPQINVVGPGGSLPAGAGSEGDSEDMESTPNPTVRITRLLQAALTHAPLVQVNLSKCGLDARSFGPLAQVLSTRPGIQSINVSHNRLDSSAVPDICSLLLRLGSLMEFDLSHNELDSKTVCFVMTAVTEKMRQDMDCPIDSVDLSFNSELSRSDDNIVSMLVTIEQHYPEAKCSAEQAHILRGFATVLWQFLFDTKHPAVSFANSSREDEAWVHVDDNNHQRLVDALKVVYLAPETPASFAILREAALDAAPPSDVEQPLESPSAAFAEKAPAEWVADAEEPADGMDDPYAFVGQPQEMEEEPEIPKQMTYNLKQVAGRGNRIPIHVMERLLATTSIHATDVDSGQSFLEHAAHTGDIQLAKLCFRRGIKLNMITNNGDTPFNITVRRGNHHMMEFLHNYGVKVNSQNGSGVTALHTAVEKNDVDAICRLIEWAADINIVDNKGRTPLHFAGKFGHMEAAMLLLELGADLNAMDEKNSTPIGYAEHHDHFVLMDRLVLLGGRTSRPPHLEAKKPPGVVDQPKFMLKKGPHLLRLQKIPVELV
jgi:hypothetical protein